MTEPTAKPPGNPLIVLGDKLARKPHLTSFLQSLRQENEQLAEGLEVRFAVCTDTNEVAVALKKHHHDAKMVLIGPGLVGRGAMVARMLAKRVHIVMVIDADINSLGNTNAESQRVQSDLEDLGIVVVPVGDANPAFYGPLIQDYVLSGVDADADLEGLPPEERAKLIDKRLDALNSFPSLPETQRKVSTLDDLDPPKKWAEAIDPDLPTKTVILRILNSARYGFRTRVETIDQAVALASARTIREIVTACQVRQIFSKTSDKTLDQFWRHSLAVAFLAKLLSLPADTGSQSAHEKAEFERFGLEAEELNLLKDLELWTKLDLGENSDAFTAGLLHDMGKVTMLMCLEDSLELVMAVIESDVQDAQEEGKMWSRNVIDVERFLMKDVDHQVIGGRLAEKWEIDSDLAQVITSHHQVGETSPGLLKLIAFCDMAANCLFPYPAADSQHPFPQLFARIDKAVKKSPKSGAAAVEQAISEEIFEDLVQVISDIQPATHLWELVDFKSFFKLAYLIAPRIKTATIGFLQLTA